MVKILASPLAADVHGNPSRTTPAGVQNKQPPQPGAQNDRTTPAGVQNNAHQVDLYVGRRIRALRLERGLTQQDLARRMGMSYQQMQKYETAANRISAGRLHQLADALGVPVVTLLPDGRVPHQAELEHAGRDRAILRIVELARPLDARQRAAIASVMALLAGAAPTGNHPAME